MQNEVERIEKAEEMKELFWNLWKRNKINGLSRFDIDQFDEIVRWASNDFEAFKDQEFSKSWEPEKFDEEKVEFVP